jgi:putative serine protease PepD
MQHLCRPLGDHATATIPRPRPRRYPRDYELARSRTTRCVIRAALASATVDLPNLGTEMTRSRPIPFLVALLAALAAGCGSAASTGDRISSVSVASADEASSLQQRFVSIVKTVSPEVVQIRTAVALGSGVVFDARGDVVTNAHVVGNATRFVVTLASGDTHPATLVGRDAAMDLAVIRITGARPRPATFANSAQVEVGDLTLAIGNPLGLRSSVTEGIVSAVGRSVPETDTVTLSSVIQTSAAINPGNSGGALVNLSGQVIGIPTLAAVDPEMGAEAPGIGFAIDSNTVRRTAIRLAAAVARHGATK